MVLLHHYYTNEFRCDKNYEIKIKLMEYVRVGDYYMPDLKAYDQMLWVRAMNSIHNRAEEIVLEEIVYR